MRPAELEGFGWRFPSEKAEEESGREAVTTAHPIENIQLAAWRVVDLAFDPGDGGPAVAVGGMNFAQGSGDNLDMRVLFRDPVNHRNKGRRIELGIRGNLRTGHA